MLLSLIIQLTREDIRLCGHHSIHCLTHSQLLITSLTTHKTILKDWAALLFLLNNIPTNKTSETVSTKKQFLTTYLLLRLHKQTLSYPRSCTEQMIKWNVAKRFRDKTFSSLQQCDEFINLKFFFSHCSNFARSHLFCFLFLLSWKGENLRSFEVTFVFGLLPRHFGGKPLYAISWIWASWQSFGFK